ncbi:hypothetical protein GDO86_008239 [Hymenochirus boettgeri]|uniref:Methenyltetrahydrofolate synthase domain-containing protein n=1 Tax=Hymenochirus boettgeri TaxID=247094 RepID=A0A8T2J284_9PIPI|nr:hypothetical protein GDO86_008239 [Hymenochirus boettgeri]
MEPVVRLRAGCSKSDIRQKVWDYIENNNLADFPRPVHHRIPNFKGASHACEKLSVLKEFQVARIVKINPDTPQKNARFLSLEAHKTLLVPTPRLRTGLFNKIIPPAGANKEVLRICSTSQGVKDYSVPIGLDAKLQVDFVVVGSMAVSEKGWRIGKGEGFADMEYAMMASIGAVTDSTVVVTIVHDCQVVDIPEELLGDHDLTVDFILTPTQIIRTNCTRSKPQGIIWSMITQEMMGKIPILRSLQDNERRAGKDVSLLDECTLDQATGSSPSYVSASGKKQHRSMKSRFTNPSDTNLHTKLEGCNLMDDATVFIGNIPLTTRVSELKVLLRDRAAVPLRLTWQGAKHRAFLDYRDMVQAEKALFALQGISISGNTLLVEMARPQKHKEYAKKTYSETNFRANKFTYP